MLTNEKESQRWINCAKVIDFYLLTDHREEHCWAEATASPGGQQQNESLRRPGALSLFCILSLHIRPGEVYELVLKEAETHILSKL